MDISAILSSPSVLLPCLLALLSCAAFIFWPQKQLTVAVEKTRLDYLRERKDAIYENLRDLNFEYRAGKYPESDYAEQRASLESEAAQVVAEMDTLSA